MKKGIHPIVRAYGLAFLAFLFTNNAIAKSPEADVASDRETYIVVLKEPSLVEWHQNRLASPEFSPQSNSSTGKSLPARLNVKSLDARAYREQLDRGFEELRGSAGRMLGRDLKARRRYRSALNGFTASLTASEAEDLSKLSQVKFVEKNTNHQMDTDAGPTWLGADKIWNGEGSIPARSGEGIVVGIINICSDPRSISSQREVDRTGVRVCRQVGFVNDLILAGGQIAYPQLVAIGNSDV